MEVFTQPAREGPRAAVRSLVPVARRVMAASTLPDAALKYVYCLVPFAERGINDDPVIRKRAWAKCEHYVCGYDAVRLEALFRSPIRIGGTYWSAHGARFRKRVKAFLHAEIDRDVAELFEETAKDDCGLMAHSIKDAAGIKILAMRERGRPMGV